MNKERVVWGFVKDEVLVCDLGGQHKVEWYAPKHLGPVITRRQYDNGYEKRITEVRQDAQGRTYHQQIGIDYTRSVWWRRDHDGAIFVTQLPRGGRDIRERA